MHKSIITNIDQKSISSAEKPSQFSTRDEYLKHYLQVLDWAVSPTPPYTKGPKGKAATGWNKHSYDPSTGLGYFTKDTLPAALART